MGDLHWDPFRAADHHGDYYKGTHTGTNAGNPFGNTYTRNPTHQLRHTDSNAHKTTQTQNTRGYRISRLEATLIQLQTVFDRASVFVSGSLPYWSSHTGTPINRNSPGSHCLQAAVGAGTQRSASLRFLYPAAPRAYSAWAFTDPVGGCREVSS
uniref:uncharacterized protein LOC118153599 n=1 Tax=Callithrix jacchus TaxID=9483 RepID=UPI0023DD0645|nr:uncharacterized protein LOC118153599 [Callithrix jacchus]